jgi:hypothetical protein
MFTVGRSTGSLRVMEMCQEVSGGVVAKANLRIDLIA